MGGSLSERVEWSRLVSYSAVFAALVFAATSIAVATPVTRGYFNLGESMVYTAAILGGPLVGAIAGGVGSAAADVALGYAHYAPGTLVIKGVEGYLVGWVFQRLRRVPRERWAVLLPRLSVLAGALLALAGLALYTGALRGEAGSVETVLELWGRSVSFKVPWQVWPILGVLAGLAVYLLGRRGPLLGAALISMFLGGLEMVAGYFIYEATVIYSLGLGEMESPLAAAAEVPVNLGQVIVGASIAVVVVGTVWRARGEYE